MSTSDLQDVIIDFRNGDERALSAIYDEFGGPLYYFARRIVDNVEEAQEITADSFIKLWKAREDFESLPHIRSFLYITTRNACFDLLRSKKKQATRQADLNYYFQQEASKFFIAEDEIKTDVLKQLVAEIQQLPEQCRKICTLSFIDGLKNSEIAHQLGLTVQTVKNHKVRSLKMMRLALQRWDMQVIFFLLYVNA